MKSNSCIKQTLSIFLIVISIFFSVFCKNLLAANIVDKIHLTLQQQESISLIKNAIRSATIGPAQISLLDEATLQLPDNFLFIPKKEAAGFEKAIGNVANDPELVGVIISQNDNLRWYLQIDFINAGYVKEDDAKNFDINDLLNTIKKMTTEENNLRISKGVAPIYVTGWIQPPTYNFTDHQLTLSINVNEDNDKVANYTTYLFGKDGFFRINLVTPETFITNDKQYSTLIQNSIHFNKGKLYTDYVKNTDRTAEFGLTALITGVIAKKLGILTIIGLFFAKTWKMMLLIFFIFFTKIKKIFKIVFHVR